MDLYNQWIEALDNYTPIHGKLRNEFNQFCCLGVLCDISNIGKWIRDDDNRLAYADGVVSIPNATALPANIQNIVGLRTANGSFDFNELSTSLQNEILEYTHPDEITADGRISALSDINDEMIRNHVNPFPIIKKILMERPPSLFVDRNQT